MIKNDRLVKNTQMVHTSVKLVSIETYSYVHVICEQKQWLLTSQRTVTFYCIDKRLTIQRPLRIGQTNTF